MIARLSNSLNRKGRGERGFTLIELLVVIIILGILAAVVVFAVRGTGDRGRSAAYATDAKTVRTAQEAYCAKNGRYASEQELVDGKYLSDPSQYHFTNFAPSSDSGAFGNCQGSGDLAKSKFVLTCNITEEGCGSGGAQATGGTLIIHNGSGVPAATLNPAVTSEGGTHTNSEDMFNGLLRYELDGSIGGDLAQSFTFDNNVPSASNPNCPPVTASATCDPTTTVATFVLREGVKFHNGDTLAPEDVEFSFAKAILAAHGRTRAINPTLGVTGSNTATVTPAEAIQILPPSPGNGGTVVFNLRQVFAPLRYTLNVTEAPIIPRNPYEACFNNNTLFSGAACAANTNPVGTGPFKFESNNGTTGITTVKNPDYFRFDSSGRRLPYFDKVIKKIVTSTGANALLAKEVDVASVAAQDRPLVQNNSSIVLTSTPRGSGGGNCITTIAFNTTKRAIVGTHTNAAGTVANPPPGGAGAIGQPPGSGGYPADSPYYGQNKAGSNENASPHKILGDAGVREAIFKALDRNKFWTDVNFNAGRVADAPVHSIFQPNGAYQGPQPLPTFDRTAAAGLLNAAGWSDTSNPDGFRRALDHPNENNPDPQLAVPDGTKLALEYLNSGTVTDAFAAEVKSQLATVGIDVTHVFGNNASFVAPKIFHARTYDMAQISYCNNDEPQFGVRRQYHTDQLVQTNAFTNASGYKSTIMDQLWLDASKAADVPTYQAKFLQIQRMALGLSTAGGPALTSVETNQRIPMVQMLESAGTRGFLATCSGFNHNNTGLYMEAASCTR